MYKEIMNKTEILSKMKEHQKAYSELSTQLKAITAEEEKKEIQERQLKRLEEYKNKYKFYVKASDDLSEVSFNEIDFSELEKLVTSSFDSEIVSYALGFDQTGMEGLGHTVGNLTSFTPMVEDEVEGERFIAREKRRREFIAKSKGQK